MHLHERMDTLFNASPWKHRTLRTIFDPFSAEWNDTGLEEKVTILRTILLSGERLEGILFQYKQYYLDQGREDIARDTESALVYLLQHSLATPIPS